MTKDQIVFCNSNERYRNERATMMGRLNLQERRDRADKANELLKEIGSCGRKFFYSEKHNQFGFFDVDNNGRIWYTDSYTGKRIYLHYQYWKRGFSNGGTMRALINSLKSYIQKGKTINPYHFGPWSDTICNGDLWGYGTDIKRVREKASNLGIT